MSTKSRTIAVIALAAGLILWRLVAAGAFDSTAVVANTIEPPDKDDAPSAKDHEADKGKSDKHAEEKDADKDDDKDAEKDKDKDKDDEKHDEEDKGPKRVSHDSEGRTVITLDAATQARIGLKIETAAQASYTPGKRAYGRLIEDPAASFTIRAPLAGFLRAAGNTTWPALGSSIAAGAAIGAIEPRFTPAERFDLITRAMDARAEVEELQATLMAARASLESKRRLITGDRLVSDRVIEEAQATVKGEEARLAAAIKKAEICEAQADPKGSAVGAIPLNIAAGGEVVELTARPGEAVESGQALLRVSDLHHLIARVELPVGEAYVEQIQSANVSIIGMPGQRMAARIIGPAPAVHPELGGQALLLAVDADKTMLRPGMAVMAELVLGGESSAGVRIPADAVLRYSGATWVYVQMSDTTFVRRRISDNRPLENGLFATEVTTAEHVVVNGCGSILSEELKSLAAEDEE